MRTTFRRQVTLIVSLLLAATILLGVSFWGLFTHYVIRERESSLRGTAQSVVWLTQTSAVSDDVTTSWDFLRTLSVASSASGNDILLCDAGGKVVLCAQDIQGCSHIGYQLPADKVEALFNGESPDLNDEAAEIYGQKRVAVALARTSSDGDRQGIVLVSVERETISELTTGALKIFMLTALAVFAVALLATPFLTNRETKPIQDMAAAARQIAHGNLNVRVSTNCQTEEMEELAVAFNNMAAAMQNADTARQEFVANVSHELKTPITSIRVLADSLMGMGEVPVELYREFMEDISDEIDREGKIIDDLLSLVKMDKSEAELNIAHVDINQLVEQVLKRLRPIANRRKVELIYESIRQVTADVDETKLSLVITNLVENAMKYNIEEGWVRVTVDADHKFFYLKVADSGIGIPEEMQDQIFDRFFRVDKARSRETGGSGLGLAITRNVVLMHKGAIKLTSKEGEGSIFTVRIPLKYIV